MIAVDWGTSSLRCYRLDGHGAIVDSRSSNEGILNVAPGKFPDVLQKQIEGWDDAPIVMSGMVGSRQGWQEAPYVPCPAGFDEIAATLLEVRQGVWIVPGVSCRDSAGVPEVMRGEEVQVLGAGQDGLICLPGTHSKWVEVKNGRIERFGTFMTGEVYAMLRQHSILGRMMQDGNPDAGAFAEGVKRSGEAGARSTALRLVPFRDPHRARIALPGRKAIQPARCAGARCPLCAGRGGARNRNPHARPERGGTLPVPAWRYA